MMKNSLIASAAAFFGFLPWCLSAFLLVFPAPWWPRPSVRRSARSRFPSGTPVSVRSLLRAPRHRWKCRPVVSVAAFSARICWGRCRPCAVPVRPVCRPGPSVWAGPPPPNSWIPPPDTRQIDLPTCSDLFCNVWYFLLDIRNPIVYYQGVISYFLQIPVGSLPLSPWANHLSQYLRAPARPVFCIPPTLGAPSGKLQRRPGVNVVCPLGRWDVQLFSQEVS